MRVRSAAAALLLVLASSVSARVISYSPYSDRVSFPATQHRMNRHFVLVEVAPSNNLALPPFFSFPTGQLVLYDSKGLDEPRVIFPQDGSEVAFSTAAAREENGVSTILIQTNANINNANPARNFVWFMSNDGGQTWKSVSLGLSPVTNIGRFQNDIGGPYVDARFSPVRIGTKVFPFIVARGGGIDAVGFDGSVKNLVSTPSMFPQLAGTSADGSQVLYRAGSTLAIADLAGAATTLSSSADPNVFIDGWVTPSSDAYVLEQLGGSIGLSYFHGTARTQILAQNTSDTLGIFAIPTFDFSGAWIIQRSPTHPTNLFLHTPAKGLVQQWSDFTAPEVEALHAGASGQTLLVQVHRPRPQIDTRIFKDPALALWHVGEAAPRVYDELFMNEEVTKAFVHLDVENAVANGDPFVFDSGAVPQGGGLIISPAPVTPPSAGGSDVIQEWGVVRASFKQKLVLPGMARTPGMFGSFWLSDVILHNPLDEKQDVTLQYVPTGSAAAARETKITLEANEIRLIGDALHSLFGLESGGGVLFVTPDSGVNATSRTYTRNERGTYGFNMNGIDFFAGAASPRFPVTFSGAFPGANFRTNVVLTDVGGRGAETSFSAIGILGVLGDAFAPARFSVEPGGQQQYNSIAASVGVRSTDSGALVIQPMHGEAIASVIAIDNRTNDPTYFPPDLPSPIVRTIPAIGHLDGINNAKYRSDLYLYNPSSTARTVTLQVKSWDLNDTQTINFTMLPNEARVIPDVLFKLFNRTGIARLRYQSSGDSNGVRVTSRTYSIDPDGGTYGFLMPPLNNFQSATSGDTLEILGVTGGKDYRTNIGLVELTAFPGQIQASAKIEIVNEKGKTIDSFNVSFPIAGGIQLNDIFRSRGLGDGPAAALIRITPLSGLIGAFATMNDNGTNDPTYLAANLAAR